MESNLTQSRTFTSSSSVRFLSRLHSTISIVTGNFLGISVHLRISTGLHPFRNWQPNMKSSFQCCITYSKGKNKPEASVAALHQYPTALQGYSFPPHLLLYCTATLIKESSKKRIHEMPQNFEKDHSMYSMFLHVQKQRKVEYSSPMKSTLSICRPPSQVFHYIFKSHSSNSQGMQYRGMSPKKDDTGRRREIQSNMCR